MKLFVFKELVNLPVPNRQEIYRPEVLTQADQAENLGGIFGVLPPGTSVPYHYHRKRESILIIISGEGTEIVEEQKHAIMAGDILFIPSGEKHLITNHSDKELRFIEFFTNPPLNADFVPVDNNTGEKQ